MIKFFSSYFFERPSGFVRLAFGLAPYPRRPFFGSASATVRLFFGRFPKCCRSGLEADSKPIRTCPEQAPKRSRSVVEEHSKGSRKATRRGVGASPSSDFFLVNFALASAFYAVGYQSSSNFPLIFPEGDPKPTRRNSEQRWEKGRSWSGVGRYLNGLFLGTKSTVNSRLSYQ